MSEFIGKTFIDAPLGFVNDQNEVLINGEKFILKIAMGAGDEGTGLYHYYIDKLFDRPIKVEKVD